MSIFYFIILQVSHFATCACLSDKTQHPTFFRTIPSDHYQAAALARLVKHFGWTWIGAVRSDSDYGNNGMASFLRAAKKEGICVEYSVAYYRTNPRSKLERVAEVIRSSTARVIVAFVASGDMRFLLEELSRRTPPPLQWIGGEAWVTDPHMFKFGLCAGAIGFGIERSVIPGLRDFLLDLSPAQASKSALLTEFWEDAFGCTLHAAKAGQLLGVEPCSGNEKLDAILTQYTDTSYLRITNMVYKAAYAIAHAIHGLVCRDRPESLSQCNRSIVLEPDQVKDCLESI